MTTVTNVAASKQVSEHPKNKLSKEKEESKKEKIEFVKIERIVAPQKEKDKPKPPPKK